MLKRGLRSFVFFFYNRLGNIQYTCTLNTLFQSVVNILRFSVGNYGWFLFMSFLYNFFVSIFFSFFW